MDWTTQIDGYCERLGPDYWAEPVNAVTNAAFLIAAVVVWRRGLAGVEKALAVILFAIGIGSYLFHTHAMVWASVADVTPILLFIMVYIHAANRMFWGMNRIYSTAGALLFIPYLWFGAVLFQAIPFFAISSVYWPVALLILIYAALLRRRMPRTAAGLAAGGGVLCLSLLFRSLDEAFCPSVPIGTHFVWHILNGAMLGWMIEVLRRHRLSGVSRGTASHAPPAE